MPQNYWDNDSMKEKILCIESKYFKYIYEKEYTELHYEIPINAMQ